MNYFPFHVGDYAAATAHLSWDEDMAYTRLLRAYYLTEQPIPLDKAYRLARATTPAQRKAVDYVLSEFFSKTDSGYTQARCETEISAYREGDAEREQKNAHEKERMRRHRDRRSELFTTLRAHEIIPAWDAPIKELQRLVDTCCNAPATRTGAFQDPYCNAPATATHNQNQEPRSKEGIGKPAFVAKDVCVGISPHTQFSDEFKTAAKSRPDLDVPVVWANFNDHYPPEKRTVSRWQQWLKNERGAAGLTPTEQGAADPDSRASVEALAASKGMAGWDGYSEQWGQYKARVLAVGEVAA